MENVNIDDWFEASSKQGNNNLGIWNLALYFMFHVVIFIERDST
jgi:hypothetical protein